jgi:hypothetical protein
VTCYSILAKTEPGGTRFLRVQADDPIKGANCVEGLKQSPIPG